MGKFIEEKAIVETYLNNYVNTTSDFSRFIEGSPNFVTYYSKDTIASTHDITLNGVYELVGVESPIKYHRIDNFPIYNMEEFTPNIDFDEEDGISTEIAGTAVILPDTIKPLTNDCFVVRYMDVQYLLRVSLVEPANINNRIYYKISYYMTTDSIEILEERQVTETFKVVYENLGKQAKSVIKTSDFLLLSRSDDAKERLKDIYTTLYYNERFNTFLFKDTIYDNHLMRFIEKNELFIKTKTFLKNIHVEPLLKESNETMFQYDETLFSAVETKSTKYLNGFYFNTERVKDKNSAFGLYSNMYTIWKVRYREVEPLESFDVIPPTIKEDIDNDVEFTNPKLFLLNYIADYLNNKLNNEGIVAFAESLRPKSSLENYLLIPCILYVLKELENSILNK